MLQVLATAGVAARIVIGTWLVFLTKTTCAVDTSDGLVLLLSLVKKIEFLRFF